MPVQLFTSLSPENKAQNLFLGSKSGSYTYNDLRRFENYLLKLLVEYPLHASPVGIWADTSDTTIFLIATCWKQGIPFVCLNPEAKAKNLIRQLNTLQPALIFSGTPKIKQKITISFSIKILPELSVILNTSNNNKNNISSHSAETIFGYFFTSGTSGSPKTVPLKRRQMHVAATASARNIKPAANHFWMLCMPLHHVGGVSLVLRSLLYGSAIYRTDAFHISEVKNHLANDQRFSVASLVPTMLKRLLDDSSFKTHPQFNAILLGGGPISPALLQECVRRDIPVIPSYGMTETCAQIAANPIFKKQIKQDFASVGKIFQPNKIEIRNKSGAVLKYPESGSIWLKGPQIFDGYLQPSANQKVIDEKGWFNTGDFGHLDENNRLFIEARRTDLIITGGENVSPFEIEDALEILEDVKAAAVFGAPDEEWGQRIVAVVVPESDRELSQTMLKNILGKTLPKWKIPKQFIFMEALPRTHTGKVQRSKLMQFLR